MKLTDRRIKSLKPQETSHKVFDGRGLYILVKPSGSKLWKMKYRFEGREKTLSLGPYPETSLSEARELCLEARKLLSNGLDPSAEQKRQAKEDEAQSTTFESLAREWMSKHLRDKSPRHAETVVQRLEKKHLPLPRCPSCQRHHSPSSLGDSPAYRKKRSNLRRPSGTRHLRDPATELWTRSKATILTTKQKTWMSKTRRTYDVEIEKGRTTSTFQPS